MVDFFENNWEIVVGIGGAIVGCYQWAVNRGRNQESSSNQIKTIEEKHGRLECVKNSDFANSVKESVQISKANNKLLTSIAKWVMKQDDEMVEQLTPDLFGVKNSPRVLNENGKKLFDEIEGQEFLDRHKEELFYTMELADLFTPLDVENSAFKAVGLMSPTPHFNAFKNYVYNAPMMDIAKSDGTLIRHELKLSDIYFVLGVPLRDMYLAEHPELLEE